MTATFKTTEIVDRIRTIIADAPLSFSPVLVQEGDLAFYVENPSPALDFPTVFIKARNVASEVTTLSGERVNTSTEIRILVCNDWDDADEVVDKRTAELQEVAELFIGSGWNLGNTISGYTIVRAVPVRLEFEPPESALLSFVGDRRLYATALTLSVTGFAEVPLP